MAAFVLMATHNADKFTYMLRRLQAMSADEKIGRGMILALYLSMWV